MLASSHCSHQLCILSLLLLLAQLAALFPCLCQVCPICCIEYAMRMQAAQAELAAQMRQAEQLSPADNRRLERQQVSLTTFVCAIHLHYLSSHELYCWRFTFHSVLHCCHYLKAIICSAIHSTSQTWQNPSCATHLAFSAESCQM